MIIKLLDGEHDYISVTGTPGIGKSVFYDYFFTRYRAERSNIPIVAASFTKQRHVLKCVVFEPGHTGQPSIKDSVYFVPIARSDAIHLYDGPPEVQPPNSKMVAFTSPNYDWLDSIRKESRHCRLYMPVWEYGELFEAMDLLGLKCDNLEERYLRFGGIARYCLASSDIFYRQGCEDLAVWVERINSVADLQSCFEMRRDFNEITHRLMHYVPEDPPLFATLKIASKEIAVMLKNRLDIKLSNERTKLFYWLEGAGRASAFAGWLFENYAHERFLKGGSFDIRSLSDPYETQSLEVGPNIGHYKEFENDLTLEMVFHNIYHMPKSQSFRSIDAFIKRTDSSLLLFQITRSARHPINAAGLVELFYRLDMLDVIRERPSTALFIFVVPAGMGPNFKIQGFADEDYWGRVTSDNLEQLDVDIIPQIGTKKRKKLHELGIRNCAHLVDAYQKQSPDVSFVANAVAEYINQRQQLQNLSFLRKIPQYVLELDLSKQDSNLNSNPNDHK
jgi:hypothetical protein